MIAVLNFLFLCGRPPHCGDATDADDNGILEITDGINILSYLFLGGCPPHRTGPDDCGPDPTDDRLESCTGECI